MILKNEMSAIIQHTSSTSLFGLIHGCVSGQSCNVSIMLINLVSVKLRTCCKALTTVLMTTTKLFRLNSLRWSVIRFTPLGTTVFRVSVSCPFISIFERNVAFRTFRSAIRNVLSPFFLQPKSLSTYTTFELSEEKNNPNENIRKFLKEKSDGFDNYG